MEEVERYGDKKKLLPFSLLIVLENAGYTGYCKVENQQTPQGTHTICFYNRLGFYSNCIVFTARFARCIVDLLALLPQMRYRTVNGELKILQNRSKCQF